MDQPPEPILLKYKHFLLYTRIAFLNRIFFKTLHTVLYIWHNLLCCVHMEHAAIQNANFSFLLSTLTPHMGKHMLHNCSISKLKQALAIKEPQVSSVLKQWLPT